MPITLLTTPPPALTPPELQDLSRSTPASFEGIAPLLRHFEQDVEVRVEPPFEGFEGGRGSLYVTEEALSFFSPSSSSGICLPYPNITLHAISRSASIPPFSTPPPSISNGHESTNGRSGGDGAGADGSDQVKSCLYCQLEESETVDEMDEGLGTREMWVVPTEQANLEKLFSSVSYCASLHPPTLSTNPSILSESESAAQHLGSQASMFASMGLDPDSMVYADENGQLAGPGLAMFGEGAGQGQGEDGQWEDVEDEAGADEESSAGRQRSDYVNPGRRAPY
ncbi:hypothetical protein JCM10212_001578 [Sporobolomyces blumeae]